MLSWDEGHVKHTIDLWKSRTVSTFSSRRSVDQSYAKRSNVNMQRHINVLVPTMQTVIPFFFIPKRNSVRCERYSVRLEGAIGDRGALVKPSNNEALHNALLTNTESSAGMKFFIQTILGY